MATRNRKTARQVVQEELEGYQVIEPNPGADRQRQAPADATSPDLAALRRKYLGAPASRPGVAERGFSLADAAEDDAADDAADFDGDGEDESDTGIVLVVPREANRGDVGAGPKAVVVSRGKIVGKQG